MKWPLYIASRYLFSKKSHNAINLISLVSVLGIAAASLAMVCTLSAFNGFQELLGAMYRNLDPDLKITAVEGKSFHIDEERFSQIKALDNVAVFCESIEENVLVRYKDSQTSALMKGVSLNYDSLTNIDQCIRVGHFAPIEYDIQFACIGVGLASTMGTGSSFIDPVTLYAAKRKGKVNLLNPTNAFKAKRILISGSFGINQTEVDDAYLITPLDFSRELLEYEADEVTSIELKLHDIKKLEQSKRRIQKILGAAFLVQDAYEQQADFYRINRMEKWITYLILCFILIIALFNVIGSLSMLILEKKKDAQVLSHLGANSQTIKQVFLFEGWMIALLGAVLGIVLGCILCLLQQHFGWLQLGDGSFVVQAYPIKLKIRDLLLVLLTVSAISIPSVWWPIRYIFGQKKEKKSSHIALIVCLLLFPINSMAQRSFGGMPLGEETSLVRTRCLNASPIVLPAFDVDSVMRLDSLYGNPHGPLHFAHKIPVNINLDNSGETFYTEDGTKVWRVHIHSPKAYSLNVVFDTFRIPPGAKLFLYDPDRKNVLGAFTHLNHQEGDEFPVAPLPGDELIIEYQEPAEAEFPGELQIYHVNHDYRGLRAAAKFQYLDIPCLPQVSCNESIETIARSVCLLILDGDTYCTGTFVNNSRQDGRPYILTAAHCLKDNPALGRRTVVFLNYQTPRCMSDIQPSEEFSLNGCQTRAYAKDIDFALLELENMPAADYRPYLAGWDISKNIADNHPFTSIHHPYGEPMRYAIEEDPIAEASWISDQEGIAPHNHWNVARWELGHTWIGSSGSALFDKNMRLVGTLTGGDSGGATGCDDYYYGDYYVKLFKAWDSHNEADKQLKHWLDPDNSGLSAIDGMDPWESKEVHRIGNIQESDEIEAMNIEGLGYLFGNNHQKINEFAERFEQKGKSLVYGVYLMPYVAQYQSSAPVTVKIVREAEPNVVLTEATLRPYYWEYKNSRFQQIYKKTLGEKENYVRFAEPVVVDGNYFVVIDIDLAHLEGDFAMFGAKTAHNTAYYFDKKWQAINASSWFSQAASMWIEPVISLNDSSLFRPEKTKTPLVALQRSTRVLQLEYPEGWTSDILIELYDTQGRLIYKSLKNKELESINLPSFLPEGVYITRVKHLNENFCFKLIL